MHAKMYTCASARLSTDYARCGKTTFFFFGGGGFAGLVFSSFHFKKTRNFFLVCCPSVVGSSKVEFVHGTISTIQRTACVSRVFGIFFLPVDVHDDTYLRQSGSTHVKRCRVLSFNAIGLIKC